MWRERRSVGKKVNCTLLQALRLCTGLTAHKDSRGIALLFHDLGTRRGWGVSVTPRPLFTPGKTRYPFYTGLGGPQGRYGEVRKVSPPTGIPSPARPTRSQSLYRLRYPAHKVNRLLTKKRDAGLALWPWWRITITVTSLMLLWMKYGLEVEANLNEPTQR